MTDFAVRLHRAGGPEVMQYEAVDVPAPAPGEARVRQHAVGINFIDIYQRSGLYHIPLPGGLGQEAAGVVADGVIGPKTLAAVEALGAELIIRRMSTHRAAFFKGLSTFATFGKGWMRRCLESEAKALEMAR